MLKRVAGTLCILLLLSALVCACAEEAPQLWEYYFNGEGGISLTHYLGQETDITLPETVDGFTVTEVRGIFCEAPHVKRVVIPAGVKKLDRNFLEGALVEEVVFEALPEEMVRGALFGCATLKTVVLPEGMTCLTGMFLADCTALETVVFTSSLDTVES